jgi:hypothetical protein
MFLQDVNWKEDEGKQGVDLEVEGSSNDDKGSCCDATPSEGKDSSDNLDLTRTVMEGKVITPLCIACVRKHSRPHEILRLQAGWINAAKASCCPSGLIDGVY